MQVDLLKILAVGSGGFIGATSRYLLAGGIQNYFSASSFPYGTAFVNILGCLLIGLLAGLFEVKQWINPELRLFLFVGILGGFTTFSTFINESFMLLERGDIVLSILNVGLQVMLGLLFVWLGFALIKLIF